MTDAEIKSLGTHGWFVREEFPGATKVAAVAARRVAAGQFSPAAISRGRLRDETVRSDSLLWVADEDAELGDLLETFEAIRLELNAGAWLGLTRFDVQLAHYPRGGHYLRHRDAFLGEGGRRVTAIVYLNPDWRPADQGQLRLFSNPPVQLEPRLGRLVVFLSEKVEHEVLPTAATRLAATAWYYGR